MVCLIANSAPARKAAVRGCPRQPAPDRRTVPDGPAPIKSEYPPATALLLPDPAEMA
jgi:hypothetical protein